MKRNRYNSDFHPDLLQQTKKTIESTVENAVIKADSKRKSLEIGMILPAILPQYCFHHTLKLDFSPQSVAVTATWDTKICNLDLSVIFANSESLISCLKRYVLFVNKELK